MTLHIELLYNEYNSPAAFAVASLLALLSLVTLGARSVLEWKAPRPRPSARRRPERQP